ncbi:uncharacterized protein FYW47_010648, partial [Aplochiton taeniatus]
MAATEACAAPVQEDGNATETKATEAEQPAATSETVNSEVVDKETVNSEVVDKETVNSEVVDNDTAAPAAEEAKAAPGEAPQSTEQTPAEEKTPKPASDNIWDSFLNKSGLGKVMGKKKKEPSAAAAAATGGEEGAAEGGEKEGEEKAEAGAAEGGAEDGGAENGEAEDEATQADAKPKAAETKSSVRDLIRKPVARIFSHRSTEKKDGAEAEPQPVKVRSKSLDRLEDAEALNAAADQTVEEGQAAEEEQKPSSASASASASATHTTKHMKRWHSFKKLMAQKTHRKSGAGAAAGGGGEDGKEGEGAEGGESGAGDSSTIDSKTSEGAGQKRWKLKRSWTFQGLKRDTSMVGISKTAKGSTDNLKAEDGGGTAAAGEGEPGADAAADDTATAAATSAGAEGEEAKAEGAEEKAEGGEEEKAAAAASGGTVTQHANEIWTSFKKRVAPKSKRANTEAAPGGEEEGAAGAGGGAGDPEAAEDAGKDKAAKAKRGHFGRAVSLKNFILRKGKSPSVDMGDGATKEEADGEAEAEAAADEPEAAAAAEGQS